MAVFGGPPKGGRWFLTDVTRPIFPDELTFKKGVCVWECGVSCPVWCFFDVVGLIFPACFVCVPYAKVPVYF